MTINFDLKLLRRLWPFVSPYKKSFFFALAVLPAAMVLNLLQPWLIKRAIDGHISIGNLEGLTRLAALYLLTVVGAYLAEATYNYLLSYTGQHTLLKLRQKCYSKLLSFAPTYFERNSAGTLLTRLTSDIEVVGEAFSAGIVSIFLDILLLLGILVAMWLLNWKLTLLLLFLSPLLIGGISLCRRKLRCYYDSIRENLAALNTVLTERLNGIEVIQLFNHHRHSFSLFKDQNKKYRDATIQANLYDALIYSLVDGTAAIAIAIMLFFAISPFRAEVSIGTLTAFIFYIQRLFRPLQEFSGKIAIIQRSTTALEKIFSLLDSSETINRDGRPIPNFKGHIRVENLKFSYRDGGREILQGISFEICPGEVVAIVGPSGSGKTTLIRVLTRTYDNYRGSISIDGTELKEISIDELRKKIVSVPQEIQLFPETVKFNISLGNPEISDEEISRAAELTHIKDFILSLPQKWETRLSNRSGNISQGQAQLLIFARALAYNPQMIILDEATASVDSQTEALIQDALEQLFKRKTTLVIAHRLSTITSADKIIVLKDGRVEEMGTHHQLLKRNGLYAKLYNRGVWM